MVVWGGERREECPVGCWMVGWEEEAGGVAADLSMSSSLFAFGFDIARDGCVRCVEGMSGVYDDEKESVDASRRMSRLMRVPCGTFRW